MLGTPDWGAAEWPPPPFEWCSDPPGLVAQSAERRQEDVRGRRARSLGLPLHRDANHPRDADWADEEDAFGAGLGIGDVIRTDPQLGESGWAQRAGEAVGDDPLAGDRAQRELERGLVEHRIGSTDSRNPQ